MLQTQTGDNITIGTTNSAEDATTLFGVIGSNGFGGGYVLGATQLSGSGLGDGHPRDSQYIGVYGSSQKSLGVYGSSESTSRSLWYWAAFAGYFNGDVLRQWHANRSEANLFHREGVLIWLTRGAPFR